jgi:hypothetical protein
MTRTRAAILLLLLLPAPASAQGVTVTATHAQKKPLALSDHVRVKLTVEGPAPLSVELPQPTQPGRPAESALLVLESSEKWGIQFVGKPQKADVGNGRERWVQEFRLDPFEPGDWYVRFAPLKVNGREVEGPGVALSVVPTKVTEPQKATGIETLPPPQTIPRTTPAILWVAVGALAATAVVGVVWRLRRRPAPVTPAAWAAAVFDHLARERLSGPALLARVADVLREFVERRFGIPATKFTTHELLAAANEQAVWSVEETDSLRAILDRCDRAKFAGDVPDDDGCRGLLVAGREWVDHVSAADAGPR